MKANLKFARSTAAAFGLIALGLAPAFAADAVMDEPPAPAPSLPVASWAGPYAGLALGYGFAGQTELRDPALEIDTDGFLINGFAGYQLENNGFVYGIEGDASFGGYKGTENGVQSKSAFDGSLRARLGVAVTPDVLLYGTLGGAAQSVKITDRRTGESDRNVQLGVTAGAGADVKVTQQVFARAEYRYTDFSRQDYILSGTEVEADSSGHRVLFGVGMKF